MYAYTCTNVLTFYGCNLDYIHILFNILVNLYFLQGFTGFIQGFVHYLYNMSIHI